MISEVTSIIQLYKDTHSIISQAKQTLFGNLKQQCETLRRELRTMEQIHIDLKDKIDRNPGPGNSEQGLRAAIQDAQEIVQELLTAVTGNPLKKNQISKRHDLRQLISEKTQSLKRARKTVVYALMCYQSGPFNQPSSGKVTDKSKVHETTEKKIIKKVEETNEPPTFKEISGILQPHDVITFKNQIFILMDGGICVYNMAGKRIRRYQQDGFKPFAVTSLGAFLFVTDKKSRCVVKFDESLKVKKRFGKSNMTEPAGITSCEKENCIYVLTGRKRELAEIAKFNSDGVYLRCYCSDSLEDPWYIKKSSSDEFFISDFARMTVDVYSYDFSERLYTVKTKRHCRGMDIDDEANIYIALRDPGYKAQYECFGYHSIPMNEWVGLEKSPVPWFWENKSLDFVRGLHYYHCQNKNFLMVVDAGNKRLKVISL